MFKCKFCEHSSDRSDNIKRHEDEKHRKMLKVCTNCGKSYTASALSRHKKTCKKEAATTIDPSMLQKDADVAAVLGANNIEYDQIAGVVEHTMNIKFITLKNGTVISLANEISVGGYTFTLNQKSIEPDENGNSNSLDHPYSPGLQSPGNSEYDYSTLLNSDDLPISSEIECARTFDVYSA